MITRLFLSIVLLLSFISWLPAQEADSIARENDFHGLIYAHQNDQILETQVFGLADRDRRIPIRLSTAFNLASCYKLFTKIAIAQLLQKGQLSLDDPVKKYIPELQMEHAEKISIHHLLTMRSGLGHYWEHPKYSNKPGAFVKQTDYLPLIKDQVLFFEPGSKRQYSNSGYELLGIIIARVSGMDYHQYIEKNIFQTAGMKRSGAFILDNLPEDTALGYTWQDEQWVSNKASQPYKGSAAGGGYSTANDLKKFGLALFSHQLLDSRHTELLFNNFEDRPRSTIAIAGGSPGINSILLFDKTENLILIVFSNLDPPAADKMMEYLRIKYDKNYDPNRQRRR